MRRSKSMHCDDVECMIQTFKRPVVVVPISSYLMKGTPFGSYGERDLVRRRARRGSVQVESALRCVTCRRSTRGHRSNSTQ